MAKETSRPSVAFLTGSLSRLAGGPFESIRRLADGVRVEARAEVKVFGLVDARWDQDRGVWGQISVEALRPVGPLRFGYMPDLGRRLVEAAPDVVHVHGLWTYPSVAALRWAGKTGRPRVVSPRGMLEPWAWAHHRGRKALLWSLFERAHCRKAAVLHATSEQEAEAVRTRVPGVSVVVIPNGVAVPPASELEPLRAPRGGKRRALFLSRIHPKKGLPLLIEAWHAVKPAGWELAIAGIDEGGHEQEVRRLVAERGLESEVVFLGEQAGKGKLQTYLSAELFVLPTYSENFGIVVAEAMACGLPVLTTTGTPWSGLRDNRAGWWVAPEVRPIAEALTAATKLSPEVLASMGASGRRWMETDFGWPSIARRFTDLYLELARR